MLLGAAALAIAWANSPWAGSYEALWHLPVGVAVGHWRLELDLHHWINDGLMAVFFLMIGLELKHELLHGALASRRTATLPAVAALGGMVLPASLYTLVNLGTWAGAAADPAGWGIPMATDIAFALGALALLGGRVPRELTVFLLALAVADDLGAILVIAIFYSAGVAWVPLVLSALLLGLVVLMIRAGVGTFVFYAPLAVAIWIALHASGVHATIAGVVLGLLVPAEAPISLERFEQVSERLLGRLRQARERGDATTVESALGELEEVTIDTEAPVARLQRLLRAFNGYVVLPLFALANAGVDLSGDAVVAAASSPVAAGVAAGLLLGKPIGIIGFSWLAVRTRLAVLPESVGWAALAGVGMLAGIGFTVAIFIATLAFADPAQLAGAKMAILAASLVAGCLGFLVLRRALPASAEP